MTENLTLTFEKEGKKYTYKFGTSFLTYQDNQNKYVYLRLSANTVLRIKEDLNHLFDKILESERVL